jgi:histidinol-phosphatase (PHP family)
MHGTGTDMVDFHTHTILCEHATGYPDDYAAAAVKKGITTLGFSDHAPLPDGLREGVTMRINDVENYIAMVETTKDTFKGKIDVRLGFEVDFPLHPTFDSGYFTDPRIDYLIGSCHYLGKWPLDHQDYKEDYFTRGVDNVYSAYYDALEACAASGLFNIIGHFDLAKKFGYRPERDMTPKITAVAKAAARTNTAVEMNTAGLRKPVGEIYPSPEIVKILFDCDVPVTLGSDAHAPEEVGADFAKAVELVKKCGYRKIASFEKRQLSFIDL